MFIIKRLSPMNKYLLKLPYQYPQYGTLCGFVYAEDEEIFLRLKGQRKSFETSVHDRSDVVTR
jgi:hypothetical protein